ncbi:hypothetical protein GCM10009789_82900 [Kribbella sancticallisti]|uniref:Uncharacterized protein n=1 Tax=Kribbella sancticallisti TaxID=460087 RepID=A0ABN2ETB2_9ACTN
MGVMAAAKLAPGAFQSLPSKETRGLGSWGAIGIEPRASLLFFRVWLFGMASSLAELARGKAKARPTLRAADPPRPTANCPQQPLRFDLE